DREAQIHERVGNTPAADPERAVARHPRDHALARVDDAEVVEPGDVDPVAHELRELLRRLRLAFGDREGIWHRPPVAHRGRRSVAGRLLPTARALGRRTVPEHAAEDAVLDELQALLRRPLEVEGLGKTARVEGVVREREPLVEDFLADPA